MMCSGPLWVISRPGRSRRRRPGLASGQETRVVGLAEHDTITAQHSRALEIGLAAPSRRPVRRAGGPPPSVHQQRQHEGPPGAPDGEPADDLDRSEDRRGVAAKVRGPRQPGPWGIEAKAPDDQRHPEGFLVPQARCRELRGDRRSEGRRRHRAQQRHQDPLALITRLLGSDAVPGGQSLPVLVDSDFDLLAFQAARLDGRRDEGQPLRARSTIRAKARPEGSGVQFTRTPRALVAVSSNVTPRLRPAAGRPATAPSRPAASCPSHRPPRDQPTTRLCRFADSGIRLAAKPTGARPGGAGTCRMGQVGPGYVDDPEVRPQVLDAHLVPGMARLARTAISAGDAPESRQVPSFCRLTRPYLKSRSSRRTLPATRSCGAAAALRSTASSSRRWAVGS